MGKRAFETERTRVWVGMVQEGVLLRWGDGAGIHRGGGMHARRQSKLDIQEISRLVGHSERDCKNKRLTEHLS